MGVLKDIKGIGPKTELKLNKANIKTTNDLLFCFPVRYDTYGLCDFKEIVIDKELTLLVRVIKKPKVYFIRKNLDKMSLEVEVNKFFFQVHIFNRRFLAQNLDIDAEIVITGKFVNNLSNFTASNIVMSRNFHPGIIPFYGIPDVIEATIRKAIHELLINRPHIEDPIPEKYLRKHNILDINELINRIHEPKANMDIINSRKRIIYEELLEFALRIESLKKLNENIVSQSKKYDIEIVKNFISNLPFELTNDQKQATNEIFKDLKKDRQMNRLLQGDVGSGKTIISVIASLAVVTSGFQVALMAPTLVLAKQHYSTFKKYLDSYGVRIALLVSEQSFADQAITKDLIRMNKVDIIIGTHSLIQESVDFHNLGFLIIDEQHRFGVNQRKELRMKGATPDILLMSATPIPRTLAISIYKDISISFIKEKPSGRKDIITEVVEYENVDSLLKKITIELDKGHQAYFICPKIIESDTSSKISVEEMANLLNSKLSDKYSKGVLHGKLQDQEKNYILERFYSGKINILISTTVVEVGVNVQNATVMVIMSADTFGLAQLHQLRGRIGRDEHQSYCYLIVDNLLDASERLAIMVKTNDGFLISEYDLSIRGPGEVFGNVQSGIPNFRMANLIKDSEIMDQALTDATEIIENSDTKSRIITNKAIK